MLQHSLAEQVEEYDYIKKNRVQVVSLGNEYIFGDTSSSQQSHNLYDIKSMCYSNENQESSEQSVIDIMGYGKEVIQNQKQDPQNNEDQQLHLLYDLKILGRNQRSQQMNHFDSNQLTPKMQISKQNINRLTNLDHQELQNSFKHCPYMRQYKSASLGHPNVESLLHYRRQDPVFQNQILPIYHIRSLETKIDHLSQSFKKQSQLRWQWKQDLNVRVQLTTKQSISEKLQQFYSRSGQQHKQIRIMTGQLAERMQIAEKKIEGLDKKMDKLIQLLTNKIK